MAVRAVRGAITVERNTDADILEGTREMLQAIIAENGIAHEDLISALFSVTKDLNAAFPAAAARQIGWNQVALMCTNEIDVPGSLARCIRVMVHFHTEKGNRDIRNVYLRGARSLRPDIHYSKGIAIAIDGPAGAGKSTVAKIISKNLGILYLDTGAMYRAAALKAIRLGISTKCAQELADMIRNVDIRIEYKGSEQRVLLDGVDVTNDIRTPEAGIGASDVSAVPAVRLKLVELQRDIAGKNDVVMDGRDIGTYVLPDARYKFFLTATVEERAKRRYLELLSKGMDNVSFEDVQKDIRYRDHNDSSRAFAPLKKAEDAVEIDTTGMDAESVAKKILAFVTGK